MVSVDQRLSFLARYSCDTILVMHDIKHRSPHSHTVYFYTDRVALGRHVATFLEEGLGQHETVFVIATKATHEAVRTHLPPEAPPYHAFDADELLSAFLRNGSLNREQFYTMMDRIFRAPAAAGKPIRVYGEMVVRLWDKGQPGAAVELEELWNQLAERYRFSLLCAYPLTTFEGQNRDWFLETCATHSHVAIVSEEGPQKAPCLV